MFFCNTCKLTKYWYFGCSCKTGFLCQQTIKLNRAWCPKNKEMIRTDFPFKEIKLRWQNWSGQYNWWCLPSKLSSKLSLTLRQVSSKALPFISFPWNRWSIISFKSHQWSKHYHYQIFIISFFVVLQQSRKYARTVFEEIILIKTRYIMFDQQHDWTIKWACQLNAVVVFNLPPNNFSLSLNWYSL